MNDTPPPAPPARDRKAGLIVFGILTILLGLLCAMFVPLMIVGVSMSPQSADYGYRMILPGLFTYGGLAVALVWLGVGSILRRRWARDLLLIFSAVWLLFGTLVTLMMVFLMPSVVAGAPGAATSPATSTIIIVVTMGSMAFFLVALPLAWLIFYRSPKTLAMCAASAARPSWTERCPLPVLALSLMVAFSAVSMLAMPFTYGGVLPAFGFFLDGWIGGSLCLLLAVVWLFLARELYRMRRYAWWILLGLLVLFTASTFLTYYVHDLSEIYTRMGMPADDIERVKSLGWLNARALAWITLGTCSLMIGYVLFVGKYLAPETSGRPGR